MQTEIEERRVRPPTRWRWADRATAQPSRQVRPGRRRCSRPAATRPARPAPPGPCRRRPLAPGVFPGPPAAPPAAAPPGSALPADRRSAATALPVCGRLPTRRESLEPPAPGGLSQSGRADRSARRFGAGFAGAWNRIRPWSLSPGWPRRPLMRAARSTAGADRRAVRRGGRTRKRQTGPRRRLARTSEHSRGKQTAGRFAGGSPRHMLP